MANDIAGKRLQELRLQEQVRAVLFPRSSQQSEVEQLLAERRGLLSLQFTTEKTQALWQELAPHISVCFAPRVGIESFPVEAFRMIVPEIMEAAPNAVISRQAAANAAGAGAGAPAGGSTEPPPPPRSPTPVVAAPPHRASLAVAPPLLLGSLLRSVRDCFAPHPRPHA